MVAHLISVLGALGLRGSGALGLGFGLLGRHGCLTCKWIGLNGGLGVAKSELSLRSASNANSASIPIRMRRNREQEGVGGQSRSGACPGVYMGKRGASLRRE